MMCKTGTQTTGIADTRARRVTAANDSCEIPVEKLWIFLTPRALNKQFKNFFVRSSHATIHRMTFPAAVHLIRVFYDFQRDV